MGRLDDYIDQMSDDEKRGLLRELDREEAESKRRLERLQAGPPKKSLARQAGEFAIACVLFAVLLSVTCDNKKAGDQRGETVPGQRGVTEPRERMERITRDGGR